MQISYAKSMTALLSSMLLSTYSDHVGRRFILMTPFLCMTVNLSLLAAVYGLQLPLYLLYVGNVVEGVGGSWFIVLVGGYSVMADISTGTNSRIVWIMALNTLQNVSMAGGVLANGLMIKYLGFFPTMAFMAANMATGFLVLAFFLPETLPTPKTKTWNLLKNLKKLIGFFLLEGSTRKKVTFSVLLMLFFFAVFNDLSITAIDAIYQLHQPFCWDSELIGYYSAFKIASQQVIGFLVLKALQKMDLKPKSIAQIGMLFQAAQYILEGLADTSWQLFLVPVVGAIGTLTVPSVRGLMSVLAGPHNQGALFGSICAIETMDSFVSVSTFNTIYSKTVDTFNGTAYLFMAGFNLLTFLLFFIYSAVKVPDS